MAVSKAYLCVKICEMAGHVRKKPTLNALNKRELMILFSYMSLQRDEGVKKGRRATDTKRRQSDR